MASHCPSDTRAGSDAGDAQSRVRDNGDMSLKTGWQGRVFEDFEVGDVYRHPLGRTITQTDNVWFTLLTVNSNPIHFDSALAAQTEFGRPWWTRR